MAPLCLHQVHLLSIAVPFRNQIIMPRICFVIKTVTNQLGSGFQGFWLCSSHSLVQTTGTQVPKVTVSTRKYLGAYLSVLRCKKRFRGGHIPLKKFKFFRTQLFFPGGTLKVRLPKRRWAQLVSVV
jgi:hypothetical protein